MNSDITNFAKLKKFLSNEYVEEIKSYCNDSWLNIVVCTVKSTKHIAALMNKLKSLKLVEKNSMFGRPESGWMICSFLDYDIHLFIKEKREYYDIDGLWREYARES